MYKSQNTLIVPHSVARSLGSDMCAELFISELLYDNVIVCDVIELEMLVIIPAL